MQTYRCPLSNGSYHDMTSADAGSAIHRVLEANSGLTVTACFSKGTLDDGVVHYEVPTHQPYKPRGVENRIKDDGACLLFNDDEVRKESARALYLAGKATADIRFGASSA